MTSKDIASKKFEKAKGFGGYKIDDVEDFMDRVAEYVEQLENEKRERRGGGIPPISLQKVGSRRRGGPVRPPA